MSPTSFFFLTVLLVLVTGAAARPREKFSQSAEDPSSSNMGLKIRVSSRGSSSASEEYSRSEDSWSNLKSKRPSSVSSESSHEESSSEMSSSSSNFGLKMKASQGGEGMGSFKTKVKSRMSVK
ncbi:seminal vesicle secretory protein 5-like [Apodemus sylvaticus]|uniref:seminal vesicle secretory protein 5-like n=1 Tax=Apodemus sylvaticus TaxID=10129 RepID=UPI0022437199|nr:seminal vesicle secretory protein 5-like [Apodemus sylvaticus]